MKKSLSKNEILSSKEIKMLFKKNKSLKTRGFGVFFTENKLPFPRFAVSVAKKYGSAVQRNYAKRIVREVYRLYKDKLQSPYDMVFVVYPHQLVFSSARDALILLMQKICPAAPKGLF